MENFNESLIIELISARNSYQYPAARMAYDSNGEIEISNGVFAKFILPNAGSVTGNDLDEYHKNLLLSDIKEDRLLGLCSIIYWGFYTFSHNYSRERVRRFIQGYKGLPPTTPDVAYSKVEEIISYCSKYKHDKALAVLDGVSQLQRTPFASKVIAFIDPANAGIYDNKIKKKLENSKSHLSGGVGSVSSPTISRKYNEWCQYLQKLAEYINTGIDSGKSWHWQAKESKPQLWRALDVERAYFSASDS